MGLLRLLEDDSHELLSPISPRKFRKMSYNVSSASDIIGALRVDALSLGCIKSSLMGLKGHVQSRSEEAFSCQAS